MNAAAIAILLTVACSGNSNALDWFEGHEEICNGMDGPAAQAEADKLGICKYFGAEFIARCSALNDY